MSITEQIVREAPEVEARKLGLLDTARNLAQMPVGGFQYDDLGNPILENVIDPVTGLPVQDEQGNVIQRPVRAGLPQQQIAGLSPQQQRAIQVGEAGVGSFEPFLASALQSQAAGLGTLGQAATAFTDIGQAPTMEQIQPFMNPYQQAISDEINRAYNIAQQGAAAQAIDAGAFGGGREGVQRAEFDAASDRNRAAIQSNLLQQGFQQAQAARQQDLANQIGLANLQSGLGARAQDFSRAQIAGLGTLGAQQQAQQQAVLDAARQTAQMAVDDPRRRLSMLGAGITQLTPGAGAVTLAPETAAAQASPLQTALGLGLVGADIYGRIFGGRNR